VRSVELLAERVGKAAATAYFQAWDRVKQEKLPFDVFTQLVDTESQAWAQMSSKSEWVSIKNVPKGESIVLQFADVPNIYIEESLVSYTPNPQGGGFNSVTLTVDGYQTEVMIMLSRLRWSWTGWALVTDIWRQRQNKSMLIIPWDKMPYWNPKGYWDEYNATASPVQYKPNPKVPVQPDKAPFAGFSGKHDALIRFNPQMWTPPQVAAAGFVSAAKFVQAPGIRADEILLHEMVHGLRQMRGTTDMHKPVDYPNYDTVEEFMAIVVANVYRSEVKRPGLRMDHHGFQPLTAGLEDPQKFLDAPGAGGESNRSRMLQLKKDHPDFVKDLKQAPAAFNPFKLI
jgi:hypothetical protein